MQPTVSSFGEHALIERITKRLVMPPWVIVGPGDDAAVFEPERGALEVMTTDAQIEGIHFDRRFVPPDAIGHRALAVNLSDLAAMGARPRAALLSLALPDALTVDAVDAMLDGLLGLAARHGVTIIGGNITRSLRDMMIDVTAIGSVHRRRILRRAGARPGDDVYVTGAVDDVTLELRALQSWVDGPGAAEAPAAGATARYLRPEPRVRAGLLLGRNRAASSCVDLSDGLADGVRQLASASAVGITIDSAAVPVGGAVQAAVLTEGPAALLAAIRGGDDYELLFTARPSHRGRLRAVRQQLGDLALTKIGVVTKAQELRITAADGTSLEMPPGFEHFR
ncbi:MAG: thiamine-phosphate kinase [Acidobacteriota bacterium]